MHSVGRSLDDRAAFAVRTAASQMGKQMATEILSSCDVLVQFCLAARLATDGGATGYTESRCKMKGKDLPVVPLDADPADLLRVVFQGKWRLSVLQMMVNGPVRLSSLRRSIPNCSKKVLLDTLGDLETIGWVKRVEFVSALKRVEYSLSEHWEERYVS